MSRLEAAIVIQSGFRGALARIRLKREAEAERVAALSLHRRLHDPRLLATKARSVQAIMAFSFFSHLIADGMKVIVIVYLTLEGVSAGDAGLIFLARSIGLMAMAPFAGNIIDNTERKRGWLMAALFVSVILNLGMIWTHDIGFMVPKNFVEGAAIAFFFSG